MSVDFGAVRSKNPEWTNCVFFNGDKKVLFGSIDVPANDLSTYITKFGDYDTTVASGVTFGGVLYDVHRFYEGVMYGRASSASKRTDGFCLYRLPRDGKTDLYVFITYDLPDVSARVVPLMVKQVDELAPQLE